MRFLQTKKSGLKSPLKTTRYGVSARRPKVERNRRGPVTIPTGMPLARDSAQSRRTIRSASYPLTRRTRKTTSVLKP
ncbi:Hypothetical protein bglu_1g00800 [Burkholderia glumae BGR1]|nr:Hypothetical protein bglu_1g00800 [Burkholderia glumae BGR1]